MHLTHRVTSSLNGALSNGAIAGIAIGATLFVATLAAGWFYFRKKWREQHMTPPSMLSRPLQQHSIEPESHQIRDVGSHGAQLPHVVSKPGLPGDRHAICAEGSHTLIDERLVTMARGGADTCGSSRSLRSSLSIKQHHGGSFDASSVSGSPGWPTGTGDKVHPKETDYTYPPIKRRPPITRRMYSQASTVRNPMELSLSEVSEISDDDSDAGSTFIYHRTPSTPEHSAVDLGTDAYPHAQSMQCPQPLSFDRTCTSMSIMEHDDSAFPNQGEREVSRVRGLPHHALDCT
ncbi:hypothetical protein BKA63DRAFT_486735 [Paraphoma chrysanthemicola]|nr:hypothetical protein BKA63DRAFT_486735 [Paraphoma chrysanthemicola]